MKRFSNVLGLAALLLALSSTSAMAKTDGILVVGTQTEVLTILKGSGVRPTFLENDANAMVAVKLSGNEMAVYEGRCVEEIIEFIGNVVEGGVVVTLKVGTALWHLLEKAACVVTHVGESVCKAVCFVLSHAKCLVVNGVTFVAHTAVEILKAIADIFH